ncbi:MAG: hypothetical protein WA547_05295 [Thermoplasmata archaeon]
MAAAIAAVLVLSGGVAASGSGYNLSYTQTYTGSYPAIGLTGVSSSYSSGSNITASFTVSGQINLVSDDYSYDFWFGGTASTNTTAWVFISNNTTTGEYYGGTSESSEYGTINYTLSNGGSTLTLSIATNVVGPSSSFAIDVFAGYSTSTTGSYDWLGTDYGDFGGGGGNGVTCTATSCTAAPAAASSLLSGLLLYAVLGIVVVVIVIVVVVMLVMRGKKPPTSAPAPGAGWMPPPQPGMAPPPPQYQPMPPPPPPGAP